MTSSLTESRRQFAEQWRNVHAINPELGTTLEDMTKSSYWAHVGKMLRPWDKIEVRAEDGSFYAEFIVRDAGRNWAKVELVFSHTFTVPGVTEQTAVDNGFTVKYAGPHAKYRVLRKADNSVMRDGFVTQADAEQWVREHIKSLAK